MSAAQVLKDALEIIKAQSKWAKQGVALDGRGNEVKPLSDKAKRFDMVGAIQRVQCSASDYGQAIRHLRNACGKRCRHDFPRPDVHSTRCWLLCHLRRWRVPRQRKLQSRQKGSWGRPRRGYSSFPSFPNPGRFRFQA